MPPATPRAGRTFLVALASFVAAAGLAAALRRLSVPLWAGVLIWIGLLAVVAALAVWAARRRDGRSPAGPAAEGRSPDPL